MTHLNDAYEFRNAMGLPCRLAHRDARMFPMAMGQRDEDRKDWRAVLRCLANISEESKELLSSIDQPSAHVLKEMADLVYVCYQFAACLGWDLDEALRRVHASNLSKFGDDGHPIIVDGKVQKGPNYKPPYLDDLVHDVPGATSDAE